MGLNLPALGRTPLSPGFALLFVQGAGGVVVQAGPRVPWGPSEREYQPLPKASASQVVEAMDVDVRITQRVFRNLRVW